MRILILAALLTASCAADPVPPDGAAEGTYAGSGRNALCIAGSGAGQRAGLIVYGEGNRNCSVSGTLVGGNLIPAGDAECRIPLAIEGEAVTLGAAPASCDYYCGYDKKLAGERFELAPGNAPVTDLAGDPLC